MFLLFKYPAIKPRQSCPYLYKYKIISSFKDALKLGLVNRFCTAPHFVNTVRQHFVEYFAGNIQPGLNIPELNGYGGCYRNLCKPLSR